MTLTSEFRDYARHRIVTYLGLRPGVAGLTLSLIRRVAIRT
jgi:hypothetical protein